MKLGVLSVAAAGPLSNLCLAGFCWLLMLRPILFVIPALLMGVSVLNWISSFASTSLR
jgi:hypothetical protein